VSVTYCGLKKAQEPGPDARGHLCKRCKARYEDAIGLAAFVADRMDHAFRSRKPVLVVSRRGSRRFHIATLDGEKQLRKGRV